MTPDAIKCLNALNQFSEPDGELVRPFITIMRETGLNRKTVRRHVRALARKGLAEYFRGLWSEETDQPAGAGYSITHKGRALCEGEADGSL